ncbi:protein phosphatase 1 regulatory subunit 3C-B-like isoform X1 [Sardina pilchardus]|uniref:protein phosphatase 1 regulatory subunit 3C-B-like isoform X1 n=2 Tax=Sardina pilchardus TaxID=27697 RepID=UPI002E120C32
MNCTRVLQILNPRPMPSPIMPVDVAMRICLAQSPPVCSFLGSYEARNLVNQYKPLRPCISSKAEIEAANVGWRSPKVKRKKSVVFADTKGMSLTAIHVFKEFEDDPLADLQFELSDLENAIVGLRVEKEKSLMLDFAQPAADYLDFRNRLKKNLVSLENCVLQDKSLSGTIKVSNVSFEKSVNVRITYDSWKTYTDVPCIYMNNVYGCLDIDTFSFHIDLPSVNSSVEFCICYKTLDQEHWDNNDGKNYKLVQAEHEQDQHSCPIQAPAQEFKSKKAEMEFDQFGSPRTSSGFFPEWQSWGHIESSTPYW